jgi:hypothetical protein
VNALTLVLALALAANLGVALPVAAQTGTESAASATCDLVTVDEIARILGFAVEAADESSRSGGVCFFATRALSDEGSAAYGIVSAADLPQRRAFFAVLARQCAGVSAAAPRAPVCATYANLAAAADLDAYFTARTSVAAATPVPLGERAVATDDALYVRRGARVIEVSVKRGATLDLPRATALAALLLARLPP